MSRKKVTESHRWKTNSHDTICEANDNGVKTTSVETCT